MFASISQTIMLLLRLLVNFKTFRHCNVEFTLVTLIVDAFMLWINSRMLIVTIWYSQWLHDYLTSVCLLSHTCLYFHSELALNTFIHKSRVVCLKLFFEKRLLKISIVTLATVFILHEFNQVLLYYIINRLSFRLNVKYLKTQWSSNTLLW